MDVYVYDLPIRFMHATIMLYNFDSVWDGFLRILMEIYYQVYLML